MLHSMRRAPKAMVLLLFGLVLGMVWAAGTTSGTPVTAQTAGGVTQLTAGAGISLSPNPITTTGTVSVAFGGNGNATTVARSNHNHDARYVRKTGDAMTGALTFSNGAQLVKPRVQNAATPPASPQPGQLWYDTAEQRLKWFDGMMWNAPAQILGYAYLPNVSVSLSPTTGSVINWRPSAAETTFTIAGPGTVLIEYGCLVSRFGTRGATGTLWLNFSHNGSVPVEVDSYRRTLWDDPFSSDPSVAFREYHSGFFYQSFPAGTHTLRTMAALQVNSGGSTYLPGTATGFWIRVTRL